MFEIEQHLIGALMLDESAAARLEGVIESWWFLDERHRFIFKAIKAGVQDGRGADVVTVIDILRSAKVLGIAGGMDYVATLAKDTPSSANVDKCVTMLVEREESGELMEAQIAYFRENLPEQLDKFLSAANANMGRVGYLLAEANVKVIRGALAEMTQITRTDLLAEKIDALEEERFSAEWWPKVAYLISRFSKTADESEKKKIGTMLDRFRLEAEAFTTRIVR